jgi:hypothetical protein
MDDVVSGDATPVEETTEAPQAEEQTSEEPKPEVEEAPADVSDQPTEDVETEEKPPRAQTRIKELTSRAKQAEEEVAYWRQLAAQPKQAEPVVTEDGTYSAEQIADVIMQKQQAAELEKGRVEAAKSMQKDIAETLQVHPDLDQDDEKAELVYNLALSKGISLKAAADRFSAMIKSERAKAEKKVIAEKAQKAGVSSPQGSSVARGETPKPDIANMSDEERQANWGQIIENYS